MAEEHQEHGVRGYEGGGEGEVKDRGLFDFLGKKEAEEKKPDEGDHLAAGVQNIHIEEGYKAQEGKKEEEKQHEKEEKEGEKHHGLLDKLHRSHSSSSSSSSSDEEVEVEGEGGIKEKIKKKKTLKEKLGGKAHGEEAHHEEEKVRHEEERKHHEEERKHHEEEKKHHEEEERKSVFVPAPPVEEPKVRVEEVELHEPAAPEEEKKGFLDKIKEKLPGHSKKPAEESAHVPPPEAVEATGEPVKVHEAAEGPEGKEKKGFIGKIVDKLSGHHKSAGEEGDKSPASH